MCNIGTPVETAAAVTGLGSERAELQCEIEQLKATISYLIDDVDSAVGYLHEHFPDESNDPDHRLHVVTDELKCAIAMTKDKVATAARLDALKALVARFVEYAIEVRDFRTAGKGCECKLCGARNSGTVVKHDADCPLADPTTAAALAWLDAQRQAARAEGMEAAAQVCLARMCVHDAAQGGYEIEDIPVDSRRWEAHDCMCAIRAAIRTPEPGGGR